MIMYKSQNSGMRIIRTMEPTGSVPILTKLKMRATTATKLTSMVIMT